MSIDEDRIYAQEMYEKGVRLADVVKLKRIEVTRAMIELGCPVPTGYNALHWAVKLGEVEQMKLLLEHGADVNIRDKDGRTPIGCIGWKSQGDRDYEILQLLLDARPNLEICDMNGKMQTWDILTKGTARAVEVLLEYGIDLTARDRDGNTLMHYIAGNSNEGVIGLFENRNFDPNARNREGFSPLDTTLREVRFTNVEYVRMLLKKGADPNCEVTRSRVPGALITVPTPLNFVLFLLTTRLVNQNDKLMEVLKLLVENGALPNGKSFIDAIRFNRRESMKPVLDYLAHIEAKGQPMQSWLEDIRKDAELSEYYDECRQEIERMRSWKVQGGLSFFTIFVGSVDEVSNYARDWKIDEYFGTSNTNVRVNFPRYVETLKTNFEKAVQRQKLKESAVKTLRDSLRLFDRNHVVIEKILSYLSDKDLSLLS